MDKKIAKEHLQRIYLIKKNIKTLEDQLMEIDTKIKGGAINYSEKVQTSGRGSTESLMCIAVDLQYKINSIIGDKLKLTDEIMGNIYKINDNTLEIILKLRYIDCFTWEKISSEVGFSRGQVHRLHGKALEKYAKIIEKNKDETK